MKLLESEAADKAHKLGYTHAGYGYWTDGSGNTVAKTVKGKLVSIGKVTKGKPENKSKTLLASKDEWWIDADIRGKLKYNVDSVYRNLTEILKKKSINKTKGSTFTIEPRGPAARAFYNYSDEPAEVDVKFYRTINQSYTEKFATKVIANLSMHAFSPNMAIVSHEGQVGIATVANPYKESWKAYDDLEPSDKERAAQKITNDFLLNLLLGNGDLLKSKFENVLYSVNLAYTLHINNRGSLLYHPDGTPKEEAELQSVPDLNDFFATSRAYSEVLRTAGYSNLTDMAGSLMKQYRNLERHFIEIESASFETWGHASPIARKVNEILRIRLKEIKKQFKQFEFSPAPAELATYSKREKEIVKNLEDLEDTEGVKYRTHPDEIVKSADMDAFFELLSRSAQQHEKPRDGRKQSQKLKASLSEFEQEEVDQELDQWKMGLAVNTADQHRKWFDNLLSKHKEYIRTDITKIERGMKIPKRDIRSFLSNFKVGESTNIPTSGFSVRPSLARGYSYEVLVGGVMDYSAGVLMRIHPDAKRKRIAGFLATHSVNRPQYEIEYSGEQEVIRPESASLKCLSIKKIISKDKEGGHRTPVVYYVIDFEEEGYNKELTEGIKKTAKKILTKYVGTPLAKLRPKKMK